MSILLGYLLGLSKGTPLERGPLAAALSRSRLLPLIHTLLLLSAVLTLGDVARAWPGTSGHDERHLSADSQTSKVEQQSDSSGPGQTATPEKPKQQKPGRPAGTAGITGEPETAEGKKPGRPAGTGGLLGEGEAPLVEVSGAYTYIRHAGVNCHGGGGSIAYNLTSWLGAVADVGGCKDTGLPPGISGHFVTYLFGPRINFRSSDRINPYAQLLVGGVHSSGTGRASADAFAMTVGGGVDVRVNHLISFRVAQAEYLLTQFGGGRQSNFRLQSGIVLRFGSK